MIARVGFNISLRLCEACDANFILALRLKNGEFLSETKNNEKLQKEWIKKYKERECEGVEFYFIVVENKVDIGCIRLYDIDMNNKRFTFGSFIIDKKLSCNKLNALDAMVTVFDFAFNSLKLKQCYFDCRKENHRANNFYKKFGAKLIKSNNLDHFYEYNVNDFNSLRGDYLKTLNNND